MYKQKLSLFSDIVKTFLFQIDSLFSCYCSLWLQHLGEADRVWYYDQIFFISGLLFIVVPVWRLMSSDKGSWYCFYKLLLNQSMKIVIVGVLGVAS